MFKKFFSKKAKKIIKIQPQKEEVAEYRRFTIPLIRRIWPQLFYTTNYTLT